jgi:hypothetical protein
MPPIGQLLWPKRSIRRIQRLSRNLHYRRRLPEPADNSRSVGLEFILLRLFMPRLAGAAGSPAKFLAVLDR